MTANGARNYDFVPHSWAPIVTNSKLKLFGPNLVVVDFDLKLKLDGGK